MLLTANPQHAPHVYSDTGSQTQTMLSKLPLDIYSVIINHLDLEDSLSLFQASTILLYNPLFTQRIPDQRRSLFYTSSLVNLSRKRKKVSTVTVSP